MQVGIFVLCGEVLWWWTDALLAKHFASLLPLSWHYCACVFTQALWPNDFAGTMNSMLWGASSLVIASTMVK